MRSWPRLIAALALCSCQAADPSAAARGTATADKVTLYRYAGSRQCQAGGLTPDEARRTLAAAGVEVLEASCGSDGRMRTAVCGSADGRIVILEVSAKHESLARAQGFAPLRDLPQAARVACR